MKQAKWLVMWRCGGVAGVHGVAALQKLQLLHATLVCSHGMDCSCGVVKHAPGNSSCLILMTSNADAFQHNPIYYKTKLVDARMPSTH